MARVRGTSTTDSMTPERIICTVTNRGIRGGYNYRGYFHLLPGQSAEVDVAEREFKHLQAVDGLTVKQIRAYVDKELAHEETK